MGPAKNITLPRVTDVNNQIDVRTIYPEAQGPTLGIRGGALTPFSAGGYKNVPIIGVKQLMASY
jgi:hypothetical protein